MKKYIFPLVTLFGIVCHQQVFPQLERSEASIDDLEKGIQVYKLFLNAALNQNLVAKR